MSFAANIAADGVGPLWDVTQSALCSWADPHVRLFVQIESWAVGQWPPWEGGGRSVTSVCLRVLEQAWPSPRITLTWGHVASTGLESWTLVCKP
jgi:hypothetical protein